MLSMSTNRSTMLTAEEQARYRERGYHFPVRAFAEEEAQTLCNRFLAYAQDNNKRMKGLLPRDRRVFLTETHFFMRWVHGIVSHARVLDAVESVLGPNILVWGSQWFPKLPRDKAFVSW